MCRTHLIGTHRSVPILLRTADGYMRDNKAANPKQYDLRRAAKWRAGPMTGSQRETIMNRLKHHLVELPVAVGLEERQRVGLEGVWVGLGWKDLVELDQLTKGQAADVLTR